MALILAVIMLGGCLIMPMSAESGITVIYTSPENEADTAETAEAENLPETAEGYVEVLKETAPADESVETVTYEPENASLYASSNVVSGTCGANGDNLKWTLDTTTGELTISGTGDMVDYDMWNSFMFSTYYPWSSYYEIITSINILDGVTSIGRYAFINCCYVTDVKISESITTIKSEAFNCNKIKSVYITDINAWLGISNLSSPCSGGADLYLNGEKLTELVIPDNVVNISTCAFYGCGSLMSVTIPEGVTNICYNAFGKCGKLKDVTILGRAVNINDGAFNGSHIRLSGYTESSAEIYADNNKIAFVSLDDSTRTVIAQGSCGESATWILYKNGELQISGTGAITSSQWKDNVGYVVEANISDGVTSTGSFYGCSSLTSVTIPDSVTSIGSYAFYGCSSLTSVTIPNDVMSIGEYAFYGCSSLTNVTIPNKVVSIGRNAFANSGLARVTIPDSVTSIGSYAFCTNEPLAVYINDIFTWVNIKRPYDCEGGGDVYYAQCFSDIKLYINEQEVTELAIPYGVQKIDKYLFCGCNSLTNVTIPDSVTSIGDYAFCGCSSLTNVTIPDSVTSIGNGAFYGCSSLTSVIIPDSVTSISYRAFSDCSSLTSVTIPDSVTSIGVSAFSGCSSLTSVTIPDSVTSIGYRAFFGCSSLTSVTIPDSVTSIGEWAFASCSSLTSVTILSKTANFGSGVFYNCDNVTIYGYAGSTAETYAKNNNIPFVALSDREILAEGTCGDNLTWILYTDGELVISGTGAMKLGTSDIAPWYSYIGNIIKVTIKSGVTTVGDNAFSACSKLTGISLPEGISSIGGFAFEGCTALTEVKLPAGVVSIGNSAFINCSSLVEITLPEGVTAILGNTFGNCSKLERVTLPGSLTEVGNYAFNGCSSLKGVYISDLAAWCTIEFGNEAANPLYFAKSLYIDNVKTTELKIPKTVESLGEYNFSGSDITSVELEDGVKSIGYRTFGGCKSLEKIVIPKSVSSIGNFSLNGSPNVTIYGYVGSTAETYAKKYNIPFVALDGREILAEGTCGDNLTWILYKDGELVISGTGAMKDYTNNILNCAPWYSNRTKITKLTIGEGVTSVGTYAFLDCSSLVNAAISDSVTSIGDHAFNSCRAMTTVKMSGNVTNIGKFAFAYCSVLTGIDIPAGVTSIGEYTFVSCRSLTSVTIPDSVTSIGEWAFASCISLTSVTIPDSVTSIGGSAFDGCKMLTEVLIPNGVKTIGEWAFGGCIGLTSVTIPESVTSIGTGIFGDCTGLTCVEVSENNNDYISVDGVLFNKSKTSLICYPGGKSGEYAISDGVTSIIDYAFCACSGLTSVTIPESVTSIGERAFYGCSSLTSVTILSKTATFGSDVFNNCDNVTIYGYTGSTAETYAKNNNIPFVALDGREILAEGTCGDNLTWILYKDGELVISGTGAMKDYYSSSNVPWYSYRDNIVKVTITDGVTSVSGYAFSECSSLTSVTISDGVTSIGWSAFNGCSGLTSVTIPDSVTSIGNGAFYNCSSLTSIDVSANNSSYSSIDGVLFNKGRDILICFPSGKSGEYVILDSVTSIGRSAFYGCSRLTSVTISDSVTSIGDGAFSGCSSLKSVYITDIEKWLNIKFSGSTSNPCCNGADLYLNDVKLTELVIPDSVTSIGDYAFYNCSSLTSVTIPDSVTSIGEYAFNGCRNLTSVTIGNGVTSIGDGAFSGCSSLTSVTIGNGVTSIGGGAFGWCSSLMSVTIPDSVTSIGSWAFSECSSLTSVTIGNSVTSIGDFAFLKCSSLTNVTIPDSVTSIGGDAFNGCSSLTSVTIPDSVTSIGSGAFHGCSSLTSVMIGNSVTSIGGSAFYNCSRLTSVTIPDSVTSIGSGAFHGCSSLTSVTIPDSVTSIGYGTFEDCSSLTSVTIPDSVTSIGGRAFYGCSRLTSVTIPDSVTSIGYDVFSGCSNLTSVTVLSKTTTFGRGVFNYCGNVTIYGYVGSTAETYANENNIPFVALDGREILAEGTCGDNLTWILYKDGELVISGTGKMTGWSVGTVTPWGKYTKQITKLTIGESVESIGSYAFSGCSNLTGVTIPDSVKTVGTCAFNGCTGLTSVVIGSGVEILYYNAFNNVTSLENFVVSAENQKYIALDGAIYTKDMKALCFYPLGNKRTSYEIPEGVDYIAYAAFSKCVYLESVSLPDSLTALHEWAFYKCTKLTSVKFGSGLKDLYQGSFRETSLVEVELPEGTEVIASNAFYDCSKLEKITIPKNVKRISDDAFYGYASAFTIYGYTGSTAETYAKNNNIPFVALDAHTHTFGTWTVVTAPSCVEGGMRERSCECGEVEREYLSALGHAYEITDTRDATCTEDGYIEFTCTRDGCDSTKRQTIQASGHHFGDDNICDGCGYEVTVHTHEYTTETIEPDCMNVGYTVYTCECGYSYRADYVEQLGHNWNDGVIEQAKTCTSDGIIRYSCTREGCEASYTAAIPAGHEWNETITVAPTCTTDGQAKRSCAACGAEETITLPAAHKWNEGSVSEKATCTTPGKKLCKCEVCSEEREFEIPTLGHNFVNGVCTRCGIKFIEVVTPQVEHPLYGMYFEIDDIESNYGPDIIDEYGVYLDHNEGAAIEKVGVYLTQDGTMWRRLIACTGENITHATYVPYLSKDGVLKYSGLNSAWINIFPLSRDSDGIWEYGNYATIGVNLEDKDGKLLLSLYDIGQAGKDTRIFDNLEEMKAWLRGEEYCEHNWDAGEVKRAASCSATGIKTYTCTLCGKTRDEVTAKLKHTFGTWTVVTAPSCVEGGLETRICSVCSHEEEHILNALGHDFELEWTVDLEPTTAAGGEKSHHCTRCDERDSITLIPKLGSNTPTLNVGRAAGRAGEKVEVDISIADNPGIVSMLLSVNYDNTYLTLTEVKEHGCLPGAVHGNNYSKRPYKLSWANDTASENITANGKLVTLIFKIKEGAPEGNIPIEVSYDNKNHGIYDVNLRTVEFEVNNGSVAVLDYRLGDVNCDGLVDTVDYIILARYVADWDGYEDKVDLRYADMNADGVVNSLDRTILARHIAGWLGYERLPYCG